MSTPNCGVIIDSSDSDALDFTGAGGTLTAGSVGVVGGCGGHCGDSTPAPVYRITGIWIRDDSMKIQAGRSACLYEGVFDTVCPAFKSSDRMRLAPL